ncbi:hypothetical protein EG328_000299 [Venturia inaequalis]|uniref:C2H2-type domain-containing protein n=1 Tax=Venturia inaequalis TaxID=5025 RepID=A0A8H3V1S9_VENIN|nr:hypothetical protein EG328_000299 [Venturia inaequalis]RDI81525.1 hypothetical protein Vi05172_g8465 [Venturia inaequalis]
MSLIPRTLIADNNCSRCGKHYDDSKAFAWHKKTSSHSTSWDGDRKYKDCKDNEDKPMADLLAAHTLEARMDSLEREEYMKMDDLGKEVFHARKKNDCPLGMW